MDTYKDGIQVFGDGYPAADRVPGLVLKGSFSVRIIDAGPAPLAVVLPLVHNGDEPALTPCY